MKLPPTTDPVLTAIGRVLGEMERQQAKEMQALRERLDELEARARISSKPRIRGPLGGLRYLTREL
jgi:hypothetical protein